MHLARTEQITDHLHAIQQKGVDDLQGRIHQQRFLQGSLQPNALAIDDVLLETLFHRQIGQRRSRGPGFLGRYPLKKSGEFGQGVIGADGTAGLALKAAAVVDQVTADLLMGLADLGQGQDFGRADNGRIHAGLTAVVQEDGVEHNPGRR